MKERQAFTVSDWVFIIMIFGGVALYDYSINGGYYG